MFSVAVRSTESVLASLVARHYPLHSSTKKCMPVVLFGPFNGLELQTYHFTIFFFLVKDTD